MSTRMVATTAPDNTIIRHTSDTTAVQGYQGCGLSVSAGDGTGLSHAHAYYFKVALNGGDPVEKTITTSTTETFTAVIALMNAQMTGALAGAVWSVDGAPGDFICTSPMWGSNSTVALSAGTTGDDLFAALTGFTAFATAVDGDGPAEDPNGYAIILSTKSSKPYPIGSGGPCCAHVYGETSVTGTITLEGAPHPDGPWAALDTSANPDTSGDIVVVPAINGAVAAVRITAGSYTGGPLRATLMATHPNGSRIW